MTQGKKIRTVELMVKKFLSERGAIPIGIAVLLLVTSLVGLVAGFKAVQTPTKTQSKAGTNPCTSSIASVASDTQQVALNTPFNCLITINPGANQRENICGLRKAGTSDWPHNVCDNQSVTAANWITATTVRIPCNSNRDASYIGSGGPFELVAFRLECQHPEQNKIDGLTVSSPFTIGSGTAPPLPTATTAPGQPTPTTGQPPPPPPPVGGKCMYITVELNKVAGANEFDAWVTVDKAAGQEPGPHVQLFRGSTLVAGMRQWNPIPFTFWPEWTGGRIPAGQAVTFRGWVDACGGTGAQEDTVTCQTNSDGTFVKNDRCRQRGGYTQPTNPPVPTTPGGGGGSCTTDACSECIFNAEAGISTTYRNAGWDLNCKKQIIDNWCLTGGPEGKGVDPAKCILIKNNQCKTQCGGGGIVPTATIAPGQPTLRPATPIQATPTPTPPAGVSCGYPPLSCCMREPPGMPVESYCNAGQCYGNNCVYPTPVPPTPTPQLGSIEVNVSINQTLPVFRRLYLAALQHGIKQFDWVLIDSSKKVSFNKVPGGDIDLWLETKYYDLQGNPQETFPPGTTIQFENCLVNTNPCVIKMAPGAPINNIKMKVTFPETGASSPVAQAFTSLTNRAVEIVAPIIPGLSQKAAVQNATTLSGKVRVNNSTFAQVEKVIVALYTDLKDKPIQELNVNLTDNNGAFELTNLENKNYFLVAFARTNQGEIYSSSTQTVKAGDKVSLTIAIGEQGLRYAIKKTEELGTTVRSGLSSIPVIGPFIEMFIVSGF